MQKAIGKIQVQNFGATHYIRCPRCGSEEFHINHYSSCAHTYHRCAGCGMDMYVEPHEIPTMGDPIYGGIDIGMVCEKEFY